VVTRLDGARKSFNAGHKGRFFLDPSLLKEVEVQRGPNSALYGSGALGGVIDMKTKDAADFLRPGERVGAEGRLGFQSANAQRLAMMTAYARPTDAVDLMASLTRRHDGNSLDGQDQKVPYSGDDIASGLVKGKVTLSEGHTLSVMAMRYSDTQDVPSNADGSTVTSSNPLVKRQTDEDTVAVTWTLAPAGWDWLDLRATAHHTDLQIDERRRTGTARLDETDLETNGIELANTSRFSTFGVRHGLTYGVDYRNDDQTGLRNGGARDSFPKAEQTTMGGFVQNEVTILPELAAIVGARYDRIDDERAGREDRSSDHVSPQATLKVTPMPWIQGWVSYAEAYRAPSLTELYVGGQHYPGNNFIANPNLRPETAHNSEIGANLKFDNVLRPHDQIRAKVTGYVNQVDDFIDQVIGTTSTRYVNVGNAEISGVEAEARYDMTVAFTSLGASRTRGKDTQTGAPLSSIPPDKVTLLLGGRWTDADLEFGWRGSVFGSNRRVPEGGTPTSGYVLHDLFATWAPSDGLAEGTRIQLGVDNLFDKSYRPHLASTRDPGRNVKLTLSRQF
jgi:hemoglobin/transferrin/lactoferrin receptor protein